MYLKVESRNSHNHTVTHHFDSSNTTDSFKFLQALEPKQRGVQWSVGIHLLIMHMKDKKKDGPQNWDWTSVLNLSFGLQMECVVPWESQDSFCSLTTGFTSGAWGCLPLPPAAVGGSFVSPSCQHGAVECSWASKIWGIVCGQLTQVLSASRSLSICV